MENDKFNEVMEECISSIRTVLSRKAYEYARGDRLSNFKRAAAKLNCTPEKALWGMAVKHDISITDLIDDLDKGKLIDLDLWNEKIGDNINYLILLSGLIHERAANQKIEDDIPL